LFHEQFESDNDALEWIVVLICNIEHFT
jgi:hypothetical protein